MSTSAGAFAASADSLAGPPGSMRRRCRPGVDLHAVRADRDQKPRRLEPAGLCRCQSAVAAGDGPPGRRRCARAPTCRCRGALGVAASVMPWPMRRAGCGCRRPRRAHARRRRCHPASAPGAGPPRARRAARAPPVPAVANGGSELIAGLFPRASQKHIITTSNLRKLRRHREEVLRRRPSRRGARRQAGPARGQRARSRAKRVADRLASPVRWAAGPGPPSDVGPHADRETPRKQVLRPARPARRGQAVYRPGARRTWYSLSAVAVRSAGRRSPSAADQARGLRAPVR
jgi:hypothetical protein